LMFSATFSDDIRGLAKDLLLNPAFVEATPRNAAAPLVRQWVHPVDQKRKPELLSHLVRHHRWEQVLVFTRTKHGANRVAEKLLQDGISAAAIHGNKSQGARTKALADFKNGGVRVLVATDIASRGLDIEQLPQVVNFDLPNVSEDYIHRIGRTGRAGANGQAVSLVSWWQASNPMPASPPPRRSSITPVQHGNRQRKQASASQPIKVAFRASQVQQGTISNNETGRVK
jgi:ATP-dependent RNA helicase RhlE